MEVCAAQEARKAHKRSIDAEYVKTVVLDRVKTAFLTAEGDGGITPKDPSRLERMEGIECSDHKQCIHSFVE